MHETLTTTEEHIGKRIDAYLASTFPEFSRGDITRGLKAETILCNDKKTKPSYRLQLGDTISYTEITTQITELLPHAGIPLEIIEENKNFIVLNKERGLQAHPSTTEKTHTLANALIARYPEIKDVGDDPMRPGIMHRLDKFTSGLMVIARNQETFDALKSNFANRDVQKTYLTLVWGAPQETEGLIEAPIARAVGYTRQKVVLNNSGRYKGEIKEATTKYKKRETFDVGFTVRDISSAHILNPETNHPMITLMEAQPKTGRMHQIRVHMRHMGHPIVGDVKYETKGFHMLNKKFFSTLDPDALHTFYLHAHKLAFTLDSTDYSYESPLPPYFQEALDNLQ